MKKNLLIAGIAGFAIMGGVASVNAISNSESIIKKEERSSIITMEKATEIALNEMSGDLKSIKLEKENSKLKYEVDLVSDYDEIEVDIDAITGVVMKVDKEKTEKTEKTEETNIRSQKSNEVSKITREKAISIALGDSRGKVTEVDFDAEDHEYEIEFIANNQKVEIKIDSQTGRILEKEYEDVHDDK
ncbi:PepSY domain-containing protein [Lederbergia panacisoli]|uniref:PepSY domain-containing protein n=1 Tax=Lederbergia panacisoli TaxID=1255251 RepID=UPI00214BA474|nr:PepSY domain-containing protein [Lederbergia panacisoli]MCR2821662.1 PepSY domain-containing protein [Lederbergia panacisoli]